MLSVKNKVNARLIAKLKTDADAPYHDKNLFFSSTNQGTPAELPCLSIVSLGEPQTENDLEQNTQNFILSTIELRGYDSKTYNNAYNLVDKAGNIMVGMRYSLIMGIEDISDSSAKIAVARFRRLVGSGDSLY